MEDENVKPLEKFVAMVIAAILTSLIMHYFII